MHSVASVREILIHWRAISYICALQFTADLLSVQCAGRVRRYDRSRLDKRYGDMCLCYFRDTAVKEYIAPPIGDEL